MRKVLFKCMVLFSLAASAQQGDTAWVDPPRSNQRPQALYAALGGAGPFFSVVYDQRLERHKWDWGFSSGLGFWKGLGSTIWTVPVSVYHLWGRWAHFFELSGGLTYLNGHSGFFEEVIEKAGIMFHGDAGYRYQHADNGFFARAGFSPLLFRGHYYSFGYLGLGYSF